eukprot:scaffold154910_cov18-Prasinocladus_malaysianus.AAC.1
MKIILIPRDARFRHPNSDVSTGSICAKRPWCQGAECAAELSLSISMHYHLVGYVRHADENMECAEDNVAYMGLPQLELHWRIRWVLTLADDYPGMTIQQTPGGRSTAWRTVSDAAEGEVADVAMGYVFAKASDKAIVQIVSID